MPPVGRDPKCGSLLINTPGAADSFPDKRSYFHVIYRQYRQTPTRDNNSYFYYMFINKIYDNDLNICRGLRLR